MDIPLSPGVIGVVCAQTKKEKIAIASLIKKIYEKTKMNGC